MLSYKIYLGILIILSDINQPYQKEWQFNKTLHVDTKEQMETAKEKAEVCA